MQHGHFANSRLVRFQRHVAERGVHQRSKAPAARAPDRAFGQFGFAWRYTYEAEADADHMGLAVI